MSLSEAPSIKITFNTAQDISDEILGGTIQFCRETGYKQNIVMLTFFWSAFLLNSQSELNEHSLTENVMSCYTRSLSNVFPQLSKDTELRQKVDEMCHHYWGNLSTDFSVIKTEPEISAFFQIAYKLNSQDDIGEANSLKGEPQKIFTQVSGTINSSIYRTLRQIDNGFGIQYKGVLDQFRYERIHQETSAKTQNDTSKKPAVTSVTPVAYTYEKTLGMGWYKFLRYFGLFASAVISVLYGINYLMGSIYIVETNGEVTSEQVYAYYGDALQVIDVAYGLFLIGFAVLAIVFRRKLAKYKPDAPKFVKIFYSISAGVPFLYAIIVTVITSQPIVVNAFVSLIVGIIILLLNIKYFNKRAHFFVDKTATAEDIVQTPQSTDTNVSNIPAVETITNTITEKPKVLFCEECGVKLVDGSTFCHKCGTKISWDED